MSRWRLPVAGLAVEPGFRRRAPKRSRPAQSASPPPSRCRRRRRPWRRRPRPQDPVGIALQQKLSAATKGRADEAEAQDRAALAAFYAGRIYAPVWVSSNGLNAKAAAAIAEFAKANDWGLDAADFPPPLVTAPAGDAPSPDALADAELAMSLTALKYARYARGGRIIDPATQLSSYLDRKPQLLEPKTVIEQLAAAGEPDAYLRRLHPQHPQFEKLRQKLPRDAQRRGRGRGREAAAGPAARARARAIRRSRCCASASRCAAGGTATPADETIYDDALKAAVIAFQTESGTRPDGIVGNAHARRCSTTSRC